MEQVAPYPKMPTGLTLISTELLGKTPVREIATTPTKVHLKALLGDSIHKVLNLCTYNHNREIWAKPLEPPRYQSLQIAFWSAKQLLKKWSETSEPFSLTSVIQCITLLEKILEKKTIVPQPDFLIKSYLAFILHLHPCPVKSERAEVTIQAWQVLCFLSLTHLCWHYSCLSDHISNEAYKIIWGLASLFDLTYLNYYVKIDSLFCFNYWPRHIFSLL